MKTSAPPSSDPAIQTAERHLDMLAELRQIGMAVSRAHAARSAAKAEAAAAVLADGRWRPGADQVIAESLEAAETFEKLSESLRLTMALERRVADRLRDLRAATPTIPGTEARRDDVGGTPAERGPVKAGRPTAGSFSVDPSSTIH